MQGRPTSSVQCLVCTWGRMHASTAAMLMMLMSHAATTHGLESRHPGTRSLHPTALHSADPAMASVALLPCPGMRTGTPPLPWAALWTQTATISFSLRVMSVAGSKRRPWRWEGWQAAHPVTPRGHKDVVVKAHAEAAAGDVAARVALLRAA